MTDNAGENVVVCAHRGGARTQRGGGRVIERREQRAVARSSDLHATPHDTVRIHARPR